MAGSDGDESVYASILARVERPELEEKLQQVANKECRSVDRRVRHAVASLTALRQLQAAAKHLRPSGDWLFQGLAAQLQSVEQLQHRLTTAVDHLQMERRTKKRKRPERRTIEEDRKVIMTEDGRWTEENVDVKRDKSGHDVATVEDESDVGVADVGTENEKKVVVGDNDSDALPCGLVRRPRGASVCMKEEPVTLSDDQIQDNLEETLVGEAVAESPMELEVFESSEESAVELEVELSDSESAEVELSDSESAMELEVFDSDSDEDFSPCLDMATKLEKAEKTTQLIEFPVAVKQLHSFLVDTKHLTIDDLDGYLFAHKRITDEEVDEIGRAIMSIVSVGLNLPLRPTIKLALYDLHAIVEQLELTLGELPAFLRPCMKKFSNYFLTEIAESSNIENKETRSGGVLL
ncbi:hypothetical protein PRIC2_011080 [Phytophthora ramorum]